MVQRVNRKRRWLLAIAALVAAAAAGIVLVLADPREDPPRFVVLKQELQNGQNLVVFRFDAPKRRKAVLMTLSAVNTSADKEYAPVLRAEGVSPKPSTTSTSRGTRLTLMLRTEAGQSKELQVLPPLDVGDVWRLRGRVDVPYTGLAALKEQAAYCWRRKSFAPLRATVFYPWGNLESALITNAVPSTPAK